MRALSDAARIRLKTALVWLGRRRILPASWVHKAINKFGLRDA